MAGCDRVAHRDDQIRAEQVVAARSHPIPPSGVLCDHQIRLRAGSPHRDGADELAASEARDEDVARCSRTTDLSDRVVRRNQRASRTRPPAGS